MSFNIADFSANLNKHGLAKNHSFRMRITPPPIIYFETVDRFPVANQALEFYCKSITLPEFDLQTSEVQHQGFGLTTRRPQSMNFPVLPVVFNVDSNLDMVKFFQLWTQHIINYDKSQGNFGSLNDALPFEMGYKKEYATVLRVDVYDETGVSVLQYQMSGAYPVNVGGLETAWANNDEVMNLSVGFTYDQLQVTGSKNPDPARFGDRGTATQPFDQYSETKVYEITDDTRQPAPLLPIAGWYPGIKQGPNDTDGTA